MDPAPIENVIEAPESPAAAGIVGWFKALSKTTQWIIIGGGVVVLLLIGYAAWRWYQKKQQKEAAPTPAPAPVQNNEDFRSPKKEGKSPKKAKAVAAPKNPADQPVTEDEFNQGLQMIEKTVTMLNTSGGDLVKIKQELAAATDDEEAKGKLTVRLQYAVNFLKGLKTQASRVVPLLLQDAKTLGKDTPDIINKINAYTQQVEEKYQTAIQITEEFNIPSAPAPATEAPAS
jgi:hypothetical protein